MKNFTSVSDIQINGLTLSQSIDQYIDKAIAYKHDPWKDVALGKQKRIGLIFLNPSLRTRLSTQIAAQQLGMQAIVFNIGSDGWSWELEDGAIMEGGSVEHIKDAVPVLSSYFDVLAIRTFPELKDRNVDYAENVLHSFLKYATVPVISLESATLHPLQSFADLITIKQTIQINQPKIALIWAPHIKPLPQCVANSFAQWMNAWDKAEFMIAQPQGMELAEQYTQGASIVYDKQTAIENADIIYIKNWSSYNDYGALSTDNDWLINENDLLISNQAKIMHCLPVRRNIEVSDFLLDSDSSIVTQQAGNRICAAQTVLSEILKQL